MIALRRLEARVGAFHLGPVSLEVGEGEYFVVVGPSGAGKSVLVETVLGIHRASAGSVVRAGEDITRLPTEKRTLGYHPQDIGLFPHMSVRANILVSPRLRRRRPERVREDFDGLVEALRLGGVVERKDPTTLSGGERQRVALARMLMSEPKVILLDEPFSAVDEGTRDEIMTALKRYIRAHGLAALHVTHSRDVFAFADRVGVVMRGALVQVGTPEEVDARPASEEVARFLVHCNVFHGVVEAVGGGAVTVRVASAALSVASADGLAVGDAVVVGVKPEEVVIIREGRPLREAVSANLFEGVLLDVVAGRGFRKLFADVEALGSVQLNVPDYVYRELKLRKGDRLRVCLKAESLWAIRA